MTKRKKIISTIISLSLISMFTVGCNNTGEVVINYDYTSPEDLKIKDISKVNISEESLNGFQFISTDNQEYIDIYDKLELVSYTVKEFDKETEEYKIDISIKNNSNETIKNINYELAIFGELGGFGLENIKIDTLKPGETINNELGISQIDLVSITVDIENENEESYQDTIKQVIENKTITGEFKYTYDNSYNKDMIIYKSLNFDGTVSSVNLVLEKDITKEEFDKSKSYHIENGSYLNIVNDEKTVFFDDVLLENVQVSLNENFDFEITAKFKNDSDKKIKSFYFYPCFNIFGYNLYPLDDDIDAINTYRDTIIEPQEEFEIVVTIPISFIEVDLDIVDVLRQIKDFDMNSNVPTIVQLIENRLLSLGISYWYETEDDISKDVDIVYAGNGKIDSINAYESKKDNNDTEDGELNIGDFSEIPNIVFNEDGELSY